MKLAQVHESSGLHIVRTDALVEPASDGWAPSEHFQSTGHRLAKRGLDVAGSGLALLIALPVLLVVALLVRLTSSGPALLRQTRIGRNSRPFTSYKFRTMRANSDNTVHREYYRDLIAGSAKPVNGAFKLANDDRITRVGRVLRRFSLDELPQLLNVLKGDMSLVGPRPPLPYEVELYDDQTRLRLLVTPGLTGLWQVSGRSKLNFRQMVDLDLEYIERWSVFLDLQIMLRTPLVVITARGAC